MRTLLDIFVIWPMPAIWLLVVGAVLLRRRVGKFLVVLATALFLIGALPATGKLLLAPLVNGAPYYPAAGSTAGEQAIMAVVVFAAGAFVDPEGRWWPTDNSINRSVAGLKLQRSTGLPMIVTGGAPLPDQPPEAEVIAQFIDLPEARTILETTGRDTFESGQAVAEILARRFPSEAGWRVILVTSPSHVARASAVLRHFDIEPLAAPVFPPSSNPASAGWRAGDFVPSAGGLKRVRSAMREYIGIGWYLITGRVGLRDL